MVSRILDAFYSPALMDAWGGHVLCQSILGFGQFQRVRVRFDLHGFELAIRIPLKIPLC